MTDFVMPSLGADMEAGTLVSYRKQPGDTVKRGDIFAEVETEKGVIEVECFSEGVVESLLVPPGTKVPVGTKLARIQGQGEGPVNVSSPAEAPRAPAPQPSYPPGRATPAARRALRERELDAALVEASGSHGVLTRADVLRASATLGAGEPERERVSPRARRLAGELGVSLADMTGSGPEGSIVGEDVLRRAQSRVEPAPSEERQARMRAAVAQSMGRSKREIPHYYLSHTADLTRAQAFLAAQNERRALPERLLVGVLFVRAVALALRELPELNAHYTDGRIHVLPEVNVGVAVSLRGGGLVAPAILNVDTRSIDELSHAFKDVVNRARTGKLTSSEMARASITMTSLGERGVDTVFPVIIPPQVAMVGFGCVRVRPMVQGGAVVAASSVSLSLAADHRVSDGHRGGLFLAAVAAHLEEPPHDP